MKEPIKQTSNCNTCEFKKLHIGYGAPDDYSVEYCSKDHWENSPPDEKENYDYWNNCSDYQPTEPVTETGE